MSGVLVAVFLLTLHAVQSQDMFQHHFGHGNNRMLEFNQMNMGYGEASRLFHAIQADEPRDFHNKDEYFDESRLRHRNHITKAFARHLEETAVFKGEVSCYTLLGSFEFTDFRAISSNDDFVIKSIEVIDDDRGSDFPYLRNGNDFVAYDPYMEDTGESKFARVVIKHKGCVEVRPGCVAVTSFMAAYKKNDEHKMGFTRINLNSRYYEQECSVLRRIFNFWPFN